MNHLVTGNGSDVLRLDEQVVIVTGGSRGIGRAGVELLAERGAIVVIADLREEEGEALATRCGDRVVFDRLDVRSAANWQEVVRRTRKRHTFVSALINCAGIIQWEVPMLDLSQEDYQRVVDVNQLGTFLGMKAASTAMALHGGGSTVNVSSTAGMRGYWGLCAYVASKFAVRGMTKTAAIELGRLGIRVNSVHPGLVDTPMTAGQPTPYGQAIARAAEPREVAEVLGFLVSGASSYATGAEFVIDGEELAAVRESNRGSKISSRPTGHR